MTPRFRTLSLFLAGALAGAAVALAVSTAAADGESDKSVLPLEEIRQFSEVFGAIKSGYVDPVEDKKLFRKALGGMLAGLDPHSSFLDEQDWTDMQVDTKGEFGGLGIEVTSDDFGVRVITPIDDTPAAKAGVLAGDIITKLDGESTQGMTLSASVKIMRGKPKTAITLTIARKGVTQPIEIRIVRDIIKIRSVKSKLLADGTVGYIRVSQFQGHTVEDFAKALSGFANDPKVSGVVLDLRNNPGGLLDAAIGVTAALIGPDKVVVSTKGQLRNSNQEFKSVPAAYAPGFQRDPLAGLPQRSQTIPVVVLVNGASASASEIVSGALQDYKRAQLMGLQTFGKGSVQTVLPLRDAALGIKLTTARYYTPSGRTIQAKGIVPDIEVEDTAEGNYESFEMREADLTGHLEAVYDPQAKEKGKMEAKREAAERRKAKEKGVTGKRYAFGTPEDFQLRQALAQLQGKPVQRADDARAKRAAEQKAKEAEKAKEDKKAQNAEKAVRDPATPAANDPKAFDRKAVGQ